MGRWKILNFAIGILVLIALGVVASYFQAQMFMHNPVARRARIDKSPADYGLSYESITLKTQDDYNLAAWYIPSQNRAAVILVHGYRSNRASMLPIAKLFAQKGYGVLLLDLRAHGESDGDLVSFGLYETRDVQAAYQYLLTRLDLDPGRIGAMGVSMGGTVVIMHAAQNPGIQAVASDSAFPSLQDEVPMATQGIGLPPFLLAPLIQWFAEREVGFRADQVSAIERIGSISPRPVFLMQGGADTTVAPESGQRLYDAAGEPRELWFEPGLGHAAFAFERPQEFEARVIDGFFGRYLLKQPRSATTSWTVPLTCPPSFPASISARSPASFRPHARHASIGRH